MAQRYANKRKCRHFHQIERLIGQKILIKFDETSGRIRITSTRGGADQMLTFTENLIISRYSVVNGMADDCV